MGELSKSQIPQVFIPGAQKSGTTTLTTILDGHPRLNVGARKEPHFYSAHANNKQESRAYPKRYEDRKPRDAIRIDASQSYMPFPCVVEAIREAVGPDARFIFVFRDPVSRAASAFKHFRVLPGGEVAREIHEVLPHDLDRMTLSELLEFEEREIMRRYKDGSIIPRHRAWGVFPFNYFLVSAYAQHVQCYLDAFPRQNFLFLKFDDLRNNQLKVRSQVASFLSIDDSAFLADGVVHANENRQYVLPVLKHLRPLEEGIKAVVPPLAFRTLKSMKQKYLFRKPHMKFPPEAESRLGEIFREDINRLAALTGLQLNDWTS